jgi:hypothetical protein
MLMTYRRFCWQCALIKTLFRTGTFGRLINTSLPDMITVSCMIGFTMKDPRTLLATISQHHLFLECACGHGSLVSVSEALQLLGNSACIRDVNKRARCGACGAKTVTDMRIVCKGASASAMLGTEADYSPSHQREA